MYIYIQYWTKRLQPNNDNLVSLYKSAAFFQFREITINYLETKFFKFYSSQSSLFVHEN